MTEHYYSPKPSVKAKPHIIEETLRGRRFSFLTDAGVFSKNGVDFGSRLLIETMNIPPDAEVLDVGCGYGPIGLSAAVLAERGKVTLVDINERAVELARDNAARNRIANVEIIQSDLLDGLGEKRFDCILTNPPIRAGKETVHRIFELSHVALKEGGILWVVIQKKQGAPSAFTKLKNLFASAEEAERDKGYRIFKCTI